MSRKNINLTAPELAAIDSMIAYLQQSNKKAIDNTFDSIFSANTNCYAATPASVATPNQTFADAAQARTIFATSTCISGLIGVGIGALKQGTPNLDTFFSKLSDGNKEITLSQLISIKNENSK